MKHSYNPVHFGLLGLLVAAVALASCEGERSVLERQEHALEASDTLAADGLEDQESGGPRVYLLKPLEGQEYLIESIDVTAVSIGITAVGLSEIPESSFRIEIDGELVGTLTEPGEVAAPQVGVGLHVASVEWLSYGVALPGPGMKATARFTVRGPCVFASQCADWTPCSLEGCVASPSGYPRCVYLQAVEQCCLSVAECPDGSVACVDANGDGFPECTTCVDNAQCDDGEQCTADSCTQGACIHQPMGECGTVADCDDGNPCTIDQCQPGVCSCQHQAIQNCCRADSECNDQRGCTVDRCQDGVCRHGQLPMQEGLCCESEADCPSLGPCFAPQCLKEGNGAGRCTWTQAPDSQGCCWSDTDCPSDPPEWIGKCVWESPQEASYCQWLKNPLWCEAPSEAGIVINELMVNPVVLPDVASEWVELFNGSDSSIDVSGYVLASLEGESCVLFPEESHLLAPGAYLVVGRVADKLKNGGLAVDMACPLTLSLANLGGTLILRDATGIELDRWAYESGTAGVSQARVSPYHAADSSNTGSGSASYDSYGNLGTPGQANLDLGRDKLASPVCDDGNPCTLDICGGGQDQRLCASLVRTGCCFDNSGCDDQNACTEDTCLPTGQCDHQQVSGCCTTDSECNDAWPCTADRCVNSRCRHEAADGGAPCCKVNADCPKPAGCGATACIDGRCLTQMPAGCCKTAAECDDGNECTLDECASSKCVHSWMPSCCSIASDCLSSPQFQSICRPTWCIQGACRLGPKAEECCESLSDCDDGNPCTLDQCNTSLHTCIHESLGAGCCVTDEDCPLGVSACDQYKCLGNLCVIAPSELCCHTDAECSDQDSCTNDFCDQGICRHTANDLCCISAADCPVRPHPCHHWECVSGSCQDTVEVPCGLMLDYYEAFRSVATPRDAGFDALAAIPNTESAQVELRQDGLLGPDTHLKLTALPGQTVCVGSPTLTASSGTTLGTLAFDWALAAWQGALDVQVWMRVGDEAWQQLELAQAISGEGMVWGENAQVQWSLPGTLSSKLQFAWCVRSVGAMGWAELDSVAVGKGRPPRWQDKTLQLWAVPGDTSWKVAHVVDLDDQDQHGEYSLAIHGDEAGWAKKSSSRKAPGPNEVLAVDVGASPKLSHYNGPHRFEVEVWESVLHDTLVVHLEVGTDNCQTAEECPTSEACSVATCVSGHCKWTRESGPCCGNKQVEAAEQCDDGNLLDNDGCSHLCAQEDADGDGIPDLLDLCPDLYEVFPGDQDGDGKGDACDEDRDGDLVRDSLDNCLWSPNSGQEDLDLDGQGDACDLDDDGDGVPDDADNCPRQPNPEQADADWDGFGDSCDPDGDNDGVPDEQDDCPMVPDPYQGDLDLDGVGDACDEDADGDNYDRSTDCDDMNPMYHPQWSVRLVEAPEFWRQSRQLGVFRERPLVVATRQGELAELPALLEPSQALFGTSEGWTLLGSGNYLALLRQQDQNVRALYAGNSQAAELGQVPVEPGSVQVSGTQAAWIGGTGLFAEVYWLRQDTPEQITQDGIAESGVVLRNETLAWAGGGEIYLHDGQTLQRITQDSILDESPALWPGGLAWVRRNAQAGKGNIVLYSEPLHGLIYVVNDVLEDRQLVGGGFGLAWIREGFAGGESVYWYTADQALQVPLSTHQKIERVWVAEPFVVWQSLDGEERSLWGYDGLDTVLLAEHLEAGAPVAVEGDQVAVQTAFGVVVSRWACIPNPDVDGDGEKAVLHGGLDCDDMDPLVKPQSILQNITQGQVNVQSAPDMHQGKLVFTASDGHDDELFYFDGRVLVRLTDDDLPDTLPRIHDGYVAWQKGTGSSSEVWWFDGNSLIPIPGSTGGSSPQVWGPWVEFTRTQGTAQQMLLWNENAASPVVIPATSFFADSISLRFGSLAWTSKATDSQVFVRNLGTQTTVEMGVPVLSDRYPQPYGEFTAWLVNSGGWDVHMGDGTTHWPITDDLIDDVGMKHWNGVLAWVHAPKDAVHQVIRRLPDGSETVVDDPTVQSDSLSLYGTTLAWVTVVANQGDIRILWRDRLLDATSDSIPDRFPVADHDQVAWLHGQDVYLWKWVCGNDWDGDNRSNTADNCPLHYNPNQTDLDADSLGDACDPDDDNDGVGDFLDNCPDVPNSLQGDADQDQMGDQCDPDADGDGHLATTYGGDDCNDLNAGIYPVWIPVVVSGASVQNGSLSFGTSGLAWAGKLGADFEVYLYDWNATQRLTENQVDDLWPASGGEWLVWESANGGDREVVLYKNGQIQWLTANSVDDRGPMTDGQRVVWYASDGQDYEIFLWDGQGTFQVTNNNKNDYHPSVEAGVVTWRGFDGNDYEVYIYENGKITNVSKNDTDDGVPSTDGEMVAFSHFDGNDYEIARWENGVTTTLTDSPRDDLDPVQKDGKTVWRRNDGHDFEIAVYESNRSVQLTDDDMEKGPPDTDSGRVVWAAKAGTMDDWDIFTYKGGKIVQITDDETQDTGPAVFGDTIAWVCGDAICLAVGTCTP